MRPDPERRRGLCRRSGPLRRAARPVGPGGAAREPPLEDSLLLQVYANRSAFRTLLDGAAGAGALAPAAGRRAAGRAAYGYLDRWGDFIVGLSYLWEGQVLLAENLAAPDPGAQPRATSAGAAPFACMLAAVLAAAAVGAQPARRGRRTLLANRLDVLERSGLPEAVLLGLSHHGPDRRRRRCRAPRARAAGRAGRGRRRPPPAAACASPASATRRALHARRFRAETCRDLCVQIDALLAAPEARRRASVATQRGRCCASVAIGHARHRRAGLAARRRVAGPGRRRGAGLQAGPAAHRAAGPARLGHSTAAARSRCRLLREAVDLARPPTACCACFDDAHPALGDWAREALPGPRRARRSGRGAASRRRRAAASAGARHRRQRARATPSMALTPKEREVLRAAGPQPVEQGNRAWRCRWAKKPSSGT